MADSMLVHAFGVTAAHKSGNIVDLFSEMKATPLESRAKSIHYSTYRVDHVGQGRNGLWYMDFGKMRTGHGPGAASKNTQTRGFRFKPGEFFYEETALLYCPKKKVAIIQYNHSGARGGIIEEYLNGFSVKANYAFDFRPKYDDDAMRKFEGRFATKAFTFAIDSRKITAADRAAGKALSSALRIGESTGGPIVEVTISAGSERKSYLSKAVKTLNNLIKVAEDRPDAVSKLKVDIYPQKDARIETIDLLTQRLSRAFTDMQLGPDRRFSRADRFSALARAYAGWEGNF